MKKRLMALVCAAALAVVALTGCSGQQTAQSVQEPEKEETVGQTEAPEPETEPTTEAAADDAADTAAEAESTAVPVRVIVLKGPTAMGLVDVMDRALYGSVDGCEYTFTIASAVDEVAPAVIKGEVDIAALPANMASILYNKTQGGVQVLAINTLGVLYIVENGETIQSVADLKGRTIYASGKGATPEYALNYILSGNGIDPEKDVQIEWKSEHTECLAALLEDENGVAMLPQPFVTTAIMKNEGIRIALSLTDEWEALQAGAESPSSLLTGVVVARKEFIDEHPEQVQAFLASYETSVAYTNENIEEASALIEAFDIVPAAVAQKAIPACNIVCIRGAEMKAALSGYLAVLAEQNPEAVGGQVPDDAFYYGN